MGKKTVKPLITKYVYPASTVYTDDYGIYPGLTALRYAHDTVNHGQEEYARGPVHCNTIEGIWFIVRHLLILSKESRRANINLALKLAERLSDEKVKAEFLKIIIERLDEKAKAEPITLRNTSL